MKRRGLWSAEQELSQALAGGGSAASCTHGANVGMGHEEARDW